MSSSLLFVVKALEAIKTSKESSRNAQLRDAVDKALADIKHHEPQFPDPEIIFLPLQLATRHNSIFLTETALDCIGKLISYSSFSLPTTSATEGQPERPPLIERAIDTIYDCFQGEGTADKIQTQIVKSLLAAILDERIVVHGAGLLKAVRQVYNVFLLSKNGTNQQMAQGSLTQMVGKVFERVKDRIHLKEIRDTQGLSRLGKNGSSFTVDVQESMLDESVADGRSSLATEYEIIDSRHPLPKDDGPKLTLKDLEGRKSFDDSQMGDGPTMVTHSKPGRPASRSISGPDSTTVDVEDVEDEVFVRDAYLVFRSFCNLSTKQLSPDQLFDVRGQAMRSKLVSLHLIHTLINNHISVFTSPFCTITNSKSSEQTPFLQAVKYYLCMSITRNGASSNDKIFEVCCEIFWLMLKYMRPPFKVSRSVCLVSMLIV